MKKKIQKKTKRKNQLMKIKIKKIIIIKEIWMIKIIIIIIIILKK